MSDDDIPRRADLRWQSAEEQAIRLVIRLVENMPAHPLLTDAVVALGTALERVADYVDLTVKK